MMFLAAYVLVPFASGCVIPLLMDWHAAPHRESLRMKALLSVAFGGVFVTLLHLLTDSSESLQVVFPLGVVLAFLGVLASAAVRRIRSRLAAAFPTPVQPGAGWAPRERQQMPPNISGARAHAPVLFRKRPQGGARKD